MTLQPDDSGVQHGAVFCRLLPAAGLGQGERVPVELLHPLEELFEEGMSKPWRVERHLSDHMTMSPRLLTSRYHRADVRSWLVRHTPTRATHLTGVTHIRDRADTSMTNPHTNTHTLTR